MLTPGSANPATALPTRNQGAKTTKDNHAFNLIFIYRLSGRRSGKIAGENSSASKLDARTALWNLKDPRVKIQWNTHCTVPNHVHGFAYNPLRILMGSNAKVPLERRRRNNLWQDMLGIFKNSKAGQARRESDLVKARLQRWVELADKALGKNHSSKH